MLDALILQQKDTKATSKNWSETKNNPRNRNFLQNAYPFVRDRFSNFHSADEKGNLFTQYSPKP